VRGATQLGLGAILLLAAAACGDTRRRPVPPTLDIAFDTTQIIRSPGLFLATVNIAAPGGMDFTQMTLTAGPAILLDSLEGYAGETEVVRPVQWVVPPGLAPGTTLRFRVFARDFIDFETVDTLEFQTVP
jgi:hypothetical protein